MSPSAFKLNVNILTKLPRNHVLLPRNFLSSRARAKVMVSQWRVCFLMIKFHNENISQSYLVIDTTTDLCRRDVLV